MSDDLRERLIKALTANRWGGDHERDSHARHNYLYSCALCTGDVEAITDVVLAVEADRADRAEAEQ